MQRYTKDLGPGAGDVFNDDDDVAMLSGPGVSEVGGVRTSANQRLELAELTNHGESRRLHNVSWLKIFSPGQSYQRDFQNLKESPNQYTIGWSLDTVDDHLNIVSFRNI